MSIRQQLELLDLSRSTFYYKPISIPVRELDIMDRIDKINIDDPAYGSRKIRELLIRDGFVVNKKKILRLMGVMGIYPVYPKRNLSKSNPDHKKYPYLLKKLEILYPNQVWATDITYIRVNGGFIYLVGIIDLFSRYLIAWRFSNTLDMDFCVETLEEALQTAVPEIFNMDQGSQFTSIRFLKPAIDKGVRISMDSKGRALDNVFIERFWRTYKYEEVFIKGYADLSVGEVVKMTSKFIKKYNNDRPHQSLGYMTPSEVYVG